MFLAPSHWGGLEKVLCGCLVYHNVCFSPSYCSLLTLMSRLHQPSVSQLKLSGSLGELAKLRCLQGLGPP